MRETWVQSLGWEDPLEKGTAIHSSILAWRIPRTGETGRPQSIQSQELDMTEQISLTHSLYPFTVLTHCTILLIILSLKLMTWRRQWQPTPVLLLGKSHGRRSLVGYTVHGVSKSQTRLSDFAFTFHFHALEKEMATHSNVLAWRIPGMAEPGELSSMGSHRVRHD